MAQDELARPSRHRVLQHESLMPVLEVPRPGDDQGSVGYYGHTSPRFYDGVRETWPTLPEIC